jgi:hypothetical protein
VKAKIWENSSVPNWQILRLHNSKGAEENVSSRRTLAIFSWRGLKRGRIFKMFCFQYFFYIKALKTWNFHSFGMASKILNFIYQFLLESVEKSGNTGEQAAESQPEVL